MKALNSRTILPNTPISNLIALLFVFLFAGCETVSIDMTEVDKAYEEAKKAQMEKVELEKRILRERAEASETVQKATLDRVQKMANHNYEAQQINLRNPEQNRHTYLVDLNTKLAAANSPVSVEPSFIGEVEERMPEAEQAPTDQAAGELYKQLWEEAKAALAAERQARENKEKLVRQQEVELRASEKRVVEANNASLEKSRDAVKKALTRLSKKTQKLYKQLVWLFGLASIGSAVFGGFCFKGGNLRMGLYSLAGFGLFGFAAFLTVWLQEHQWVVWLLIVGGISAVVAAIVLRQGYQLRQKQLVGLAGKRDAITRFVTEGLKKNLTDFGMAANETMNDLDLNELEDFVDRVVAQAKADGIKVPAVLVED